MAKKPAAPVVVDVAAQFAAFQAFQAMQAAGGAAVVPVAPAQAAKAAPAKADLSKIAAAIASGECEVRMTVKNKPFACIKFDYDGKKQNLNVWLA